MQLGKSARVVCVLKSPEGRLHGTECSGQVDVKSSFECVLTHQSLPAGVLENEVAGLEALSPCQKAAFAVRLPMACFAGIVLAAISGPKQQRSRLSS